MNDLNKKMGSRRGFLKVVVAAGGAIPLTHGVASAADSPAPALPPPLPGYTSFSQDEAAFVEAMVNIMCPADEFTPAGVDCGLALYIDRQLAGDFGRGARRYMRGPWRVGKPQLGYQLPLTPAQFFSAGVEAANAACKKKYGKPFDQAAPIDGDAFLHGLAAGQVTHPQLPMASWFNELILPLFNQACFADPIYGGNGGKTFWKLVGYPGLPATNTINVVQYRGKPFPGAKEPKSIADFS